MSTEDRASGSDQPTGNEPIITEAGGPFNFPVRWHEDDSVSIQLANHVFVRIQDDLFFVSFGQLELPREIGLSSETQERLTKEGILVHTVARIVVTPAKMRDFAQTFSQIYELWERKQASINEGEAES